MSKRTAVVLFVRDPRLEAVTKRLMGRRSVAVHAALLADSATRLRTPHADLVFAWQGDEERAWALKPRMLVAQRGRTFGERLANASRDVAALGYEQLILVGADCPAIDSTVIGSVVSELERVEAVVGPATDGGINLLALRAGVLDRIELSPLPWLTASLSAALERLLKGADISFNMRPATEDIDSTEALGRELREHPYSLLARLVDRALASDEDEHEDEERAQRLPLNLFGPSFLKSPPDRSR